jgi:hypothetical protein
MHLFKTGKQFTVTWKYFQKKFSILDSNRGRRRHTLTEENLKEIGARLEISPRKLLDQLAQQKAVYAIVHKMQ